MSNTPPQSNPRGAVRLIVPAAFLNAVAAPILRGLIRGKIRRADADKDALRRILENYQPIIPSDDQDAILVELYQ
jgi:hypothetical protein